VQRTREFRRGRGRTARVHGTRAPCNARWPEFGHVDLAQMYSERVGRRVLRGRGRGVIKIDAPATLRLCIVEYILVQVVVGTCVGCVSRVLLGP
jgi:hypothetical protein